MKLTKKKTLILILLLAAVTRLAFLGRYPNGGNQDEVYGAYNAWALMTDGIDARGYAFPVYFIAWGSGMSVLYSYLAIPLFAVFGPTLAVYRIVQGFFGVLSVAAMYLLGKELCSEKFGLFLAFFLTINPWHIMITRFGLDADLAPAMFVIGLTFLVYGLRRNVRFFYGAAVFFAASLYCYAQTWLILPAFLVLFVLLYYRQIPHNRAMLRAGILLLVLALPLVWFVGVNLGLLPEVRTSFFSIPKLYSFRSGEISPANLKQSLLDLLRVILTQTDGISYTSSQLVGAFYLFTTPFLVFGVVRHLVLLIRDCRMSKPKKETDLQYLFLLWFVCAAVMAVLNMSVTTIHINMLYLPVIFYAAYGLWEAAGLVHSKVFLPVCVAFLIFSFGLFGREYLTMQDGHFFDTKAEQAIETAKQEAGDNGVVTIFRNTSYKYSNLMWYEKFPAADFSAHAVYGGVNGFEDLMSYGQFRYIDQEEDIRKEGVYMLENSDRELFENLGFSTREVNAQFSVARWPYDAR